MHTQQQITGKWYEFSLDLLIPDGEDYPKDWPGFMRWLGEDHGQYVSNLSLIPSTTFEMHLDQPDATV